jgi:group I intron endonuclease
MIVYKITNKLNGKSYIGQTIKNMSHRWLQHCKMNSHCIALNSAIQKYGKNAFLIEEIAKYTNQEDLNNAEEYYIEWYNTLVPNGYNLRTGGNSSGKHNSETLARMSNARKGSKNPMYGKRGKLHHLFGKKHSIEAKNKMSLSHRGNTAHLGKPHSEETKKQMSLDRKGAVVSKETREKISLALAGSKNPFFGKKHSKESRLKMGLSRKGVPHKNRRSSEGCANIAAAKQGSNNPMWGKSPSKETIEKRSRALKLAWIKRKEIKNEAI